MTLYELVDTYKQLLELGQDPSVDPDVFKDTMEAISGEIEEKADAYSVIISSYNADVDQITAEIERLTKLKKMYQGNIKSMKDNLMHCMKQVGKVKFKTALRSFYIRKNPESVVIDRFDDIPEEYLVQQQPTVDKTKLKSAIKLGIDIQGAAHLEQTESVIIK